MENIKKSYEALKESEQAPHIQYDKEEVRPDVIQKKKWDLFYYIIAFVTIIVLYFFSFIIDHIKEQNKSIAAEQLQIKDLSPIVKKMKIMTSAVNYNTMNINKFLLESLFFVGDKNYEIVNKLKLFFEDPKVIANLGDFHVTEIFIGAGGGGNEESGGLKKIPIKIRGSYQTYRDIETMVNFLNNMKPVVLTETVNINQNNEIDLTGYLFLIEKDFLEYNYSDTYKQINELLRLKEEYDKNNTLYKKLLEDPDLGLANFGISKIYNCNQYETLLEKQGIEKASEIQTCKALENLVKEQEVQLDAKFNVLITSA